MSTRTAPTKFRDHPIEYVVDEANRAVVCIIHGCNFDAYRALGVTAYWDGLNLGMARDIKAVAICAPEDTFNAETGKQIAFARARKKYWIKITRRMIRYKEFLLAEHRKASKVHGGFYAKLTDAEHSLQSEIEYATRGENA